MALMRHYDAQADKSKSNRYLNDLSKKKWILACHVNQITAVEKIIKEHKDLANT